MSASDWCATRKAAGAEDTVIYLKGRLTSELSKATWGICPRTFECFTITEFDDLDEASFRIFVTRRTGLLVMGGGKDAFHDAVIPWSSKYEKYDILEGDWIHFMRGAPPSWPT